MIDAGVPSGSNNGGRRLDERDERLFTMSKQLKQLQVREQCIQCVCAFYYHNNFF